METREYFEKVMLDYNQNRKGRSLRKYCKEEAVDYDWLGAENIAFMFSLFESCKLNDINFGDYIEDILTRLMEGEQDFMSLIPCNYNSNKKMNVKVA